jgi:hypothetical protein
MVKRAEAAGCLVVTVDRADGRNQETLFRLQRTDTSDWGLGAFGQAGVERVLEQLRTELYAAVQQVGAPTIGHLLPGMVRRA